jgi:hypothetical protein
MSTNKMNEYQHLYDGGSGGMAAEYPKSDNNGSASDAPTIPKDDGHLKEGLEEVVERNQTENPKLARALAVIKGGHCAIGQESKSAEDGRQALEHTRAVRMAFFNVGERDISNVRVILASFGIFAIDMADMTLMRWGSRRPLAPLGRYTRAAHRAKVRPLGTPLRVPL